MSTARRMSTTRLRGLDNSAPEGEVVSQIERRLGIPHEDAQQLADHQVSYEDCCHLNDAALDHMKIDRIGPRRRIMGSASNVTINLILDELPPCRVVISSGLTPDALEVLIRGAFRDVLIDKIFGLRHDETILTVNSLPEPTAIQRRARTSFRRWF